MDDVYHGLTRFIYHAYHVSNIPLVIFRDQQTALPCTGNWLPHYNPTVPVTNQGALYSNKTLRLPSSALWSSIYLPLTVLITFLLECPKNCTSCGDNGNCKICDDGFFSVQTRLLQRTICVPCGGKMKKKWPDVFAKECKRDGNNLYNMLCCFRNEWF